MTKDNISHENGLEIIGLIPAGGISNRLSPIPCSKEIYPIGFGPIIKDGGSHPKVVCHYLLEKLKLAGISKVYIILRSGKWDIPTYLGDGKMFDMDIAYLIMNLPFGVPYTLDQAYPFTKDAIIALGMPDIIFYPENAFLKLLQQQAATNADVVLGLMPVKRPHKWDMVNLDEHGRIRHFVIKPAHTHLTYAWVIAVWTPVFSNFMHQYLIESQREIHCQGSTQNHQTQTLELYTGDVFQAAVKEGLSIETVIFPNGSCIDIGTPEDLVKALNFTK